MCCGCGLVISVCMEMQWNNHSEIKSQEYHYEKGLQDDFQTIEYISQLFHHQQGVTELCKYYAQTVRKGIATSSNTKHRSYRGRQRHAVLLACWVYASKEHHQEISPSNCIHIFRSLPDCSNIGDQKCTKYLSDGRKIVESVLSEKQILGFADSKKHEKYLLQIKNILNEKTIHKYAMKLLRKIEERHNGELFLQAHTPENIASALFYKASQVSHSTYIKPERMIDALQQMGHKICASTMEEICKQIEQMFDQTSADEQIQKLLLGAKAEKAECVSFTAQVLDDERSRFLELMNYHNLNQKE